VTFFIQTFYSVITDRVVPGLSRTTL